MDNQHYTHLGHTFAVVAFRSYSVAWPVQVTSVPSSSRDDFDGHLEIDHCFCCGYDCVVPAVVLNGPAIDRMMVIAFAGHVKRVHAYEGPGPRICSECTIDMSICIFHSNRNLAHTFYV